MNEINKLNKKIRLDEYLVKYLNVQSRNQAVNLINKGLITVNNQICFNKHLLIKDNDIIKVNGNLSYVSRAGLKLESANKIFNIDFNNKIVVDLGASTGGFSHYCLNNNVAKIYCVDVGSDQLHHLIKDDKRVVNYEKTNIKDLNDEMFKEPIDIVVSDLSFISSKFMFESIKKLNLNDDFNLISLIKPQFEVGNQIAKIKKGYIDIKYHQIAIDNVCKYASENGFKVKQIVKSPILGAKKQNQEYLLWGIKSGK